MAFPGVFSRVRRMLRDRWLGLVLGMWMQSCGGISYTFSLYSADMKRQLSYSQEMTDGLGTSKDIGGNVGILSGLLIDIFPAHIILFVGAACHFLGYSMLYLASIGSIKPPFWQMCAFIMIGTNGATWFNTAVLVTCIRNFQGDRGVVVGLLKGFIGLSGAVFTQVYTAVYAPHTGPFLLLCAVVPPLMALACMPVIRPMEGGGPAQRATPDETERDTKRFAFIYMAGIGLAFYLMAVILIQEMFPVGKIVSKAFMLLMLAILLLPAVIPWQAASLAKPPYSPLPTSTNGGHAAKHDKDDDESHSHGSSSSFATPSTTTTTAAASPAPSVAHAGTSAPSAPGSSASASSSSLLLVPDSPSANQQPRLQPSRLGLDHTLLQAVKTQDYWLLFFAMGCGTGSGLTAINNLGQMAEALGSTRSVGAFVALVSVWNFLGRLGAGYYSEYYVKRYGTPRPLFMLLVQSAMGVAHLLFASALPQLLYVGSALVGMAHGAHWTLMVATASELFGLQHFGALYNTLSISATVGSYCLSVKLAGYIYDRQVAAERAAALAAGLAVDGHHKCLGAKCFRPTFLIMAAVCGCGALALVRLVSRTRRLYQELHKVQTS